MHQDIAVVRFWVNTSTMSVSSTSLLAVSLMLYYQAIFVLAVQDDICRPFNKSSGLAELCGYNNTAKFADMRKEYMLSLYFSEYFGNCTKTIRQVLCSTRFPRCEPDIKGPFLPCKSVLLDTLSRCGEEMRKSSISEYSWFKWYLNLLPEKNDPTSSNFKKRCFEPPNFKTDVREGDLEPNKCFPLIVSPCQNYGYKFTIFPEEEQKHRASIMLKNATKECEKMASKLLCEDFLPPCYSDSKYVGATCRDMCQEYFKKNCSSPAVSLTKDDCVLYPKGSKSGGHCKATEWVYADVWPGALQNDKSSPVKQKASGVLSGSAILVGFAMQLYSGL